MRYLIFVVLLVASQAQAAPYFRPLDLANPQVIAGAYLDPATNIRFYMEQNNWMHFNMRVMSSRIQPDKISSYWDFNTEESSQGSGAINPGFGGCEMNGAGSSDPIVQQITIMELPSTIGQGLFCGDISLYRKRK